MHWPRKIRLSLKDENDRTLKKAAVENFKSVPVICLGEGGGLSGQSQGQDMKLRPTEVFAVGARSYCKPWDKFGQFEQSLPSSLSPESRFITGLKKSTGKQYIILLIRKQSLTKRRSWVQLPGIQGICAVNCCHESGQPDRSGCASTERHSVLWRIPSRRR